MLRVGITGGIGSGKTALTDWLAGKGIVIVDADLASRTIVAPGQPALREIVDTFGSEYLQHDGQLDRAALRTLVFSDEEKRRQLERITHPRIREELARQMDSADSTYVVLSSPLLFGERAVNHGGSQCRGRCARRYPDSANDGQRS